MTKPKEIPIERIIAALLDENTIFNPRFFYRLSDINPKDLALLQKTWPKITLWRRQALLEDLEQLGDDDLLLSFESIGRLALNDSDPKVRTSAIRILWDYEASDLLPDYFRILHSDPDAEVRATTAGALGPFVYLGEIEELSEDLHHAVEDHLLEAIAADNEPLVRRRALEAISYSSRPEVPGLIQSAFDSGDKDWMSSALISMGRSADERWDSIVLEMLGHRSSRLRAEAARASGELELSAAAPRLVELAEDGDAEVRQAAIWSLSQVGGEGVRQVLETLWEHTEDEDEVELIEDALDNLAFTEDMQPFAIFDLPSEPKHLRVEVLDSQNGGKGRDNDTGLGDEDDFEDEETEEDFVEFEDEDYGEPEEVIDIEAEVLSGLDDEEEDSNELDLSADLEDEFDEAFDEEDDLDSLADDDDLDLDIDADDDEDL